MQRALVITTLVLALAGAAQAQTILKTAESAALEAGIEAAIQSPSTVMRRRSMGRTLVGIGLIGAGIATAFYSQDCGTQGSLGDDQSVSDGVRTYTLAASGLVPHVVDGRCDVDFTVRGVITGNFTGIVYANVSGRYSSLRDLDVLEIADVLKGSATGRSFYPKGRLYAGLGIAAAGAVLAAMFSEVPVAVTRLDRNNLALGTTVGW